MKTPNMSSQPYLLTIFLASFGWIVTNISDRLSKEPIIEWRKDIEKDGLSYIGTYYIKNISSDKVFTDLKFSLTAEGLQNDPIVEYKPPGRGGQQEKVKVIESKVKFNVFEFQPGCEIFLKIKLAKNDFQDLNVSAASTEERRARITPVQLLESNIKTNLLEYEFTILIVLFISWPFLIFVYFAYSSFRNGVRSGLVVSTIGKSLLGFRGPRSTQINLSKRKKSGMHNL